MTPVGNVGSFLSFVYFSEIPPLLNSFEAMDLPLRDLCHNLNVYKRLQYGWT